MIKRSTRWVVTGLLCAVAGATQAFPDKPITLIVPFAAGSTTDVNARDFAQILGNVVKQPIVLENRTGAEGAIAGQALVNAPADGHMLLFTSSSLPVLDPLMKKAMPYDPVKVFAPVCTVARTSNVMNITAGSPLKTAAEVVAAAKAQPEKLTFAYSSATTRLAAELFQQTTGVKLRGVPYRSSVTALTEVASGQVDLMFIDHVSAQPFYETSKVRPLAAAGAQRIKALPNVPSATEAGVPGYNILPWFAVYASAKTPPAVLAQVRDAVGKAMASPGVASNLEKRGLEPMAICGDAFVKFQKDDIELWRGVLNKAGIEPQ
ncbi:tripartite tricarboxylate transporter substrate binding protein [Variovorax defluvii]|uniref:Tripartite tricarboxylate transporter substrate binding protein n=1 Tax=Variovorax defluvii TaxID=913761 RepID=A0ABP8I8L7_9BURK